jgi:Family of unknown function (DUF6058)
VDPAMTDADIAYVRANYHSLERVCAGRRETPEDVRRLIAEGRFPHPSYVLPDDLSGDYGVCLKEQTPENIVRKEHLVTLIDRLLAEPRSNDPGWRTRLRASVDELDALERPFAPESDRARWGPSSRDRCITGARERFPDVFTQAA